MRILVTGGLGYIGSHTIAELISQEHSVFVVDDMSNSSPDVLNRLKRLTSREIAFEKCDICDFSLLSKIFKSFMPDVVIHFAAYKSGSESVLRSLDYYQNNVAGTIVLLKVMDLHNCKKLIFSSSATVYGSESQPPFCESSPTKPENPYGNTKLVVETLLRDWTASDKSRTSIALRYFNPIGAHPSGLIGEMPNGIPDNLMPYLCNVASGASKQLTIFGDNFNTRDGTGERDYVHVVDLAQAHISAMKYSEVNREFSVFNVGTGRGTTVIELIQAFEKVTGVKVNFTIAGRRVGDVDCSLASVEKIRMAMNWESSKTIHDMCLDSWNWQLNTTEGHIGGK